MSPTPLPSASASVPLPPPESRRPVRRGETLYYAGDPSPTLYRLETGLLRAVRLTPAGPQPDCAPHSARRHFR